MANCRLAVLWRRPLDDLSSPATAAVVAAAIAGPEAYVLKPQREGGGNNLYGACWSVRVHSVCWLWGHNRPRPYTVHVVACMSRRCSGREGRGDNLHGADLRGGSNTRALRG